MRKVSVFNKRNKREKIKDLFNRNIQAIFPVVFDFRIDYLCLV